MVLRGCLAVAVLWLAISTTSCSESDIEQELTHAQMAHPVFDNLPGIVGVVNRNASKIQQSLDLLAQSLAGIMDHPAVQSLVATEIQKQKIDDDFNLLLHDLESICMQSLNLNMPASLHAGLALCNASPMEHQTLDEIMRSFYLEGIEFVPGLFIPWYDTDSVCSDTDWDGLQPNWVAGYNYFDNGPFVGYIRSDSSINSVSLPRASLLNNAGWFVRLFVKGKQGMTDIPSNQRKFLERCICEPCVPDVCCTPKSESFGASLKNCGRFIGIFGIECTGDCEELANNG